MTGQPFQRWLETLPEADGFLQVSTPRPFAHDEAQYDAQYNNLGDPNVGRGLVALIRQSGADVAAPALEIGCGTGLLSIGLAESSPYPIAVITDPSPAFLKITRRKMDEFGIPGARVRYAVLLAEEVDRLPPDALSLIVLRSTLHHVLDVDRFIRLCARALRPGGVLSFQEPCMEGYILMGALAQFLPMAVERRAGRDGALSPEHARKADRFVRTMLFYARRDADKSGAEDKHLFRVDELMRTGDSCGLAVEFIPNRAYEHFAGGLADRPPPDSFTPFFRAYLKYCMSFDEALVRHFDEALAPFCSFIEQASAGSAGPYLHGVFLCRKR